MMAASGFAMKLYQSRSLFAKQPNPQVVKKGVSREQADMGCPMSCSAQAKDLSHARVSILGLK
jgi:hypothetical protein